VILSDTVGFISELPTTLVAAFRATLEEVMEADVIVHVRDISHGDTDAQAADVEAILKDLGVDPTTKRLIEVWNKVDLLDDGAEARLHEVARRREDSPPIPVSALKGQGADGLLDEVEARISAGRELLNVVVDAADGEGLHWLYEHSEVMERHDEEDGLKLVVRVPPQRAEEIRHRFP
jgi:GTP-binding protein HflX